MLGRGELIHLLAHLAAPLTPFSLVGAPQEEELFIDWIEQRSTEQFERILDDAVDAFIDIVVSPPAAAEYVPPARNEDFWRAELLSLAEHYGRTPHELKIVQGLEPALTRPGARVLAIKVLSLMSSHAARARLRELSRHDLTQEEKRHLDAALAEPGGTEEKDA